VGDGLQFNTLDRRYQKRDDILRTILQNPSILPLMEPYNMLSSTGAITKKAFLINILGTGVMSGQTTIPFNELRHRLQAAEDLLKSDGIHKRLNSDRHGKAWIHDKRISKNIILELESKWPLHLEHLLDGRYLDEAVGLFVPKLIFEKKNHLQQKWHLHQLKLCVFLQIVNQKS
jgi:hypothetical protein